MTTEREKVAIDLIYAALNSAVDGRNDRDAFIAKVAISLGISVCVCMENDIDEELAVKLLRNRFEEYRETIRVN